LRTTADRTEVYDGDDLAEYVIEPTSPAAT
jgi:hypothetical protein